MRSLTLALLLCCLQASRAQEANLDVLTGQLKEIYGKCEQEIQSIKDLPTAKASALALQKLLAERDTLVKEFNSVKRTPARLQAANAKITESLKPVVNKLQKEVIRISLIPEALREIEEVALVREMAQEIEAITRLKVMSLELAMKVWIIRNGGEFPKELKEVERFVTDPKTALKDPWGREWQYDVAGKHHEGKLPDIWTVSPFGGGKKLIGNWAAK